MVNKMYQLGPQWKFEWQYFIKYNHSFKTKKLLPTSCINSWFSMNFLLKEKVGNTLALD